MGRESRTRNAARLGQPVSMGEAKAVLAHDAEGEDRAGISDTGVVFVTRGVRNAKW